MNIKEMFCAVVVGLLSGCSANTVSTTLCAKTIKSGGNLQPLQLNGEDADRNLGVGYLDVNTTNSLGQNLSRRCSMRFQPDPTDASQVNVFTAVHCLYAASSDEFKNSKYTLQVYFKNGYIPVSIEFDGFATLSRLSQTFDQFLSLIPREKFRWNFAMTENSIEPCVKASSEFSAILGTEKMNIACFGKNEMRVMSGKIAVQNNHKNYLDKVIAELRAQLARLTEKLSASELQVIKIREKTTLMSQKTGFYLRQIAYWLSEGHCATSPEQLPINPDGFSETQALCPYRKAIIDKFKSDFFDQYTVLEPVLLASTAEESRALHSSIFACNISDVSDLEKTDLNFKTVCDLENFNRFFWYRWAKKGTPPSWLESRNLGATFGLSPESYFSLYFNKKTKENGVPHAALTPITKAVGTLSGEALNQEVLMLNFDNTDNSVSLTKTDSGSIVSIFGILPIATLSTLDGEATSGGASIIPLPQPDSDQEHPTAKKSSDRSCQ